MRRSDEPRGGQKVRLHHEGHEVHEEEAIRLERNPLNCRVIKAKLIVFRVGDSRSSR